MEFNQIKYRFDDFTHEHYKKLLLHANENYRFINYNKNCLIGQQGVILWRHDVDFSIHEALNLAKIENSMGVQSTFFLLLHSDFYNLLEESVSFIVREIIKLGHYIGLHFDPTFYNIEESNDLDKWLQFEKEILQSIFSTKINVFSFHNPTDNILKFDKLEYGGMINTYSDLIKKNFFYCSDSNGYWRYNRLCDVLTEQKPTSLQILTHPEWWTEKIMSPKEKVWRCADKRAEKVKKNYEESVRLFGRDVIDW